MSRLRLSIAAMFCFATASFLPVGAAPPSPAPDGWPQILHDGGHSSVSGDQQLSASTAQTIGLNWMSAMRAADLGGPVSAYNATLGAYVAYVGDERGDLLAFNESNGAPVWSTSLGFNDFIRSTPAVAPDGSVWAGTGLDPTLYKLDGATGKVLCSLKQMLRIDASVMFATPPGGVLTVYTATVDGTNTLYGKVLAIRESDCKQLWYFDKWRNPSSAWATPAFGVDAKGRGRVYVGSASPDEEMYAIDALTGRLAWYHSVYKQGDFDIGSAATVSPPGNNGFADGVLYFHAKYGIMYAVDLTTGKTIWEYNYDKPAHLQQGGISSAALYGTMLVFGVADGIEALDARSGKLLWHYKKAEDVVSSPAIVGPLGNEIVVFGDATGRFIVLRLSDGAQLYSYQTGNYFTSSPAILNGHVLIASTDSFLYDFVTGGANVGLPQTAITAPVTGSKLHNHKGSLTVSGMSTDSTGGGGVTEVQISVQTGGPTGPWYDASSGTWVTGAFDNYIPVENPGQKQSAWSFSLPVPTSGATYQVFANTEDLAGQVDRAGAQTSFAVAPDRSLPHLTLSSAIVPPTGGFTAFGTKFGPNETVDFVLQGKTIGHGTSTSKGFVPKVKLDVPGSATFGPSALTATGETSHKTTTAPLDVTNVWTQSGYGPTHTGYEPNDKILEQSIEATHNGFLSRAWLYMTSAPIAASPAIVAGAAYVANTAGAISSIDTASGAPFWTYTIQSKAAIHGAPAVGDGDVVFGADDRNIYRLASSNGTLIGSETLDGIPTSPALAGTTIYVGTANGTVYAIGETSGNVLWSTPVGAAISGSPAVDAAAGVVIVGDSAGHITMLDPSTGAVLRQTSTGGASVTAGPAVSAGKVLVGASDGIFRAFDEKSSALDWTYAAGSPIHALATTNTDAYVGSDAGHIAKVRLRDGKAFFVAKRQSAVVGIGHAPDASVDETSNGTITAGKDNARDRRQYDYQTGAGLSTQPAIVDGAVFIGAGDGGLYAFTNHGQSPDEAREHARLLQLRKEMPVPPSWPARR